MFDQIYPLNGSEFHLIVLEGNSDLLVRGTTESSVRVRGDGEADEYKPQYAAEQNTLTLELKDDLQVFIPGDLTFHVTGQVNDLHIEQVNCRLLYVERVKQDAGIKSVTGDVELGGVGGDLVVATLTGNLQVGGVGSDAQIKNVTGNLTLRGVGGDLAVQDVKGNVMLVGIGGDARLTEIEGSVNSLTTGGDLVLHSKFQPDRVYEFTAGGDMVLMLDPEGDFAARLEAVSGGGVVNRLGGENTSSGPGTWSGEFGQGGPIVKLRAGGEIILRSTHEERDRHIRIEVHREEVMHAREQARRVRDEALRVRHEAQRMKQEVREQIRAQRDEIRRSVRPGPTEKPGPSFGGFSFGLGRSGKKFGEPMEAPAPTGATEEERLKILKMLEDKTITAEQAEMLLSALGE